jgi:hypothetical protein
VLRVRCCDPSFSFHGPWAGGLTAMQLTAGAICDGRVLIGRSLTRFCEAPLARPVWAEPRV